jgi:hypothetical protein
VNLEKYLNGYLNAAAGIRELRKHSQLIPLLTVVEDQLRKSIAEVIVADVVENISLAPDSAPTKPTDAQPSPAASATPAPSDVAGSVETK